MSSIKFVPDKYTKNGALTLSTSDNARIDLFFNLTRNFYSNPNFTKIIDKSLKENILDTIKILFNGRDCRGGKGDHQTFIVAMLYLYTDYHHLWRQVIKYIPFYGRYKDWIEIAHYILIFEKDELKFKPLIDLIVDQLEEDYDNMYNGRPISLLAKWIPSENKKWNKSNILKYICKSLFNTPNVQSWHYKRLRVEYLTPMRSHSNIVEIDMCYNHWDDINFSHVPSIAMHLYKDAFKRHVPNKFNTWKQSLLHGNSKVNFSQLDPHIMVKQYLDILNPVENCDEIIEEQWKNLIEKVKEYGSFENTLAICDVSGSMTGTPMQVCIALGILISSITQEPFTNSLITFSSQPEFHIIPNNCKTLFDKVHNISSMYWSMTTDLNAVFKLILDRACAYELSESQMPKQLIIFSDMEFNTATESNNKTNFQEIQEMYRIKGYKRPKIIFWNLASSCENIPVQFNQNDVATISGFRPDILQYILKVKDMTPYNILRETIDSSRYKQIELLIHLDINTKLFKDMSI
jgi:hypothetical protein